MLSSVIVQPCITNMSAHGGALQASVPMIQLRARGGVPHKMVFVQSGGVT
jgi:hypothetical protein|tara:strand:+ start:934 stop:1083 length:150 start_codon:yes stop_codon:yes gene_type:complete